MMRRRAFLGLGCGAAAACVAQGARKPGGPVKIMRFSDSGKSEGVAAVDKVVMTKEEWKKKLSPEEYAVTREAATERPFTGKTWNNHEKGLYRCVDCSNALFASDTKFESGTGWPSFYAPIDARNVETVDDRSFGSRRTEVKCAQCDGHLGHVFNDGPQPTGLRYCMNSAAMNFIKYS